MKTRSPYSLTYQQAIERFTREMNLAIALKFRNIFELYKALIWYSKQFYLTIRYNMIDKHEN